MALRSIREDELTVAARSASVAFAVSLEDCVKWFEQSGVEHLRTLDEEGVAAAFLMRVPMGQFVNGAALSMMGVAGVTVLPEHRAAGRSKALMESAVRAMYDEGWVLSTLYPSTQTLYRSVGYEQCGALFEHTVPRAEFTGLRAGDFTVRALTVDDPAVRALYGRYASGVNGYLDRGDYVWNRIAQHRGTKFDCLGCFRTDGTLAAYACLTQVRDGDDIHLKVRDFAYEDAFGARCVLALVDRFTTVSDTALFLGGPVIPLLALLPQQKFTTRRIEYAMTRVVHVERALRERRYSTGVRARVCLSVSDALIAENTGDFTIELDGDGRASVARAKGDGVLGARLDVRALAPLFMGWSSATTLASIGAIEGDTSVIALLDGVFAAAQPALCDYF